MSSVIYLGQSFILSTSRVYEMIGTDAICLMCGDYSCIVSYW
jgi:hypothetical protein